MIGIGSLKCPFNDSFLNRDSPKIDHGFKSKK